MIYSTVNLGRCAVTNACARNKSRHGIIGRLHAHERRTILGWLGAGIRLRSRLIRLPAKLSGRWTFVVGGKVFVDTLSLYFRSEQSRGSVSGRVTWCGINCGARDEPLKVLMAPNLRIAYRDDGTTQCQYTTAGRAARHRTRHLLLEVQACEKTFEGEARSEGTSADVTMSVTL